MVYEVVLFDLDGTLVGTRPEHRYILIGQTLKELGRSSSRSIIDRFWFETCRDEIIRYHFGLEPSVFWEAYRPFDTCELREQFTEPYPDVDFIHELKAKGLKTGIVTAAPPHIADLEIGMIGKEHFDAVVYARSTNGIRSKPDPQGLEECLRLFGARNDQAMYVGNSEEDVLAAKNAQVLDILIQRGEFEFPDIRPTVAIRSLYELRHVLGTSRTC